MKKVFVKTNNVKRFISGNQIAINTLDLNTEWLEIETKLNKIAGKILF